MIRIETALPGVCVLEPKSFGDNRGFFFESYNERVFASLGIQCPWVQDNHSRSARAVVRGLHYQLGKPQDKLVRVIQGEVFDVVVDVRVGSPTFGRWISVVLSSENKRILYIPKGYAHGFSVTSESAEFLYKCSDYYAPEEERGIIWNDEDLSIPWPIGKFPPKLSAKDSLYGPLRSCGAAQLPKYIPHTGR